MADEQKVLQGLTDEYQDLQNQLATSVQARQKLESQEQENQNVKKEFDGLKDDANIYKLMGPILLKQDRTEAVMGVDARLDFIKKEVARIEKQITDIQEQSDKKRGQIIEMQTQMQQAQAGVA